MTVSTSPHPQVPAPQAIVTGASRGIGRAVAKELARHGTSVILVARPSADLEAAVAEIDADGGKAVAFPLDLADIPQVSTHLETLLTRFGPCQILVNNAGMGYTASVSETPLADWQQVQALNVTAPFLCMQAVLPGMRELKTGTIVNVVSIAGKRAFPGWSAYCASKFGLLGLSQAVAQEERSHGIRVTAFCPGSVNTPLWDTPTVQADFDRSQMLTVETVATTLVQTILLPPTAVVEELVLMPGGGAF